MKSFLYRILLNILFILISCGSENVEEQKKNLNGYWEIERVDSPYGNNREYKISETIDYIEVKNDSGFRAKVLPRLDGTIITNGNTENIVLSVKDDSLRLNYNTDFDRWSETVISAKDNKLVLKNNRGMIYTYTKYKPINLEEDGLLPEKQ
ncbi:MAG: lipocalin family protein [Leeuwenhoekiella sp.]